MEMMLPPQMILKMVIQMKKERKMTRRRKRMKKVILKIRTVLSMRRTLRSVQMARK